MGETEGIILVGVIVIVLILCIAYAIREPGHTLVLIGALAIICSPAWLLLGAPLAVLALPLMVSAAIGGVLMCALGAIVNGQRDTVAELRKLNARLDSPPGQQP